MIVSGSFGSGSLPRDELGVEVRRARDEDEAVRGEDSGGCLVAGTSAEVSSESNANVRIQPRPPHEDEVLAQLVDSQRLRVFRLVGDVRRMRVLAVEQELERLAEALAGV